MQMERYPSDKENIRLQKGKSIIKMSSKNISSQNLTGEQLRSYRIWRSDQRETIHGRGFQEFFKGNGRDERRRVHPRHERSGYPV
jgi:hypothetical protein